MTLPSNKGPVCSLILKLRASLGMKSRVPCLLKENRAGHANNFSAPVGEIFSIFVMSLHRF